MGDIERNIPVTESGPTYHLRRIMALTPDYVGTWLTNQYAGSKAHGTYVHKPNTLDDVDIVGVWLPKERGLYGLDCPEHWMKPPGESAEEPDGELDICTYEVRKFARLLVKGNPNVLGVLWSPHVGIYLNMPLWTPWIDNRGIFLSMRCLDSFSGYAYAQLMRLERPNKKGYMGVERKGLFREYGYDIKNAAHCVRLLRMGLELMETGQVNVDRTDIDAEELKEIKSGKWTLDMVKATAIAGLDRLEAFRTKPPFPARPDYEAVDDLLIRTMKEGVR